MPERSPIPHTYIRDLTGAYVLTPVPVCPWCGSRDKPLPRFAGLCANSWHLSHPEHGRMWSHPEVPGG